MIGDLVSGLRPGLHSALGHTALLHSLPLRSGELLNRVERLAEDGGTVLAVSMTVAATLLCARLHRLVERLEHRCTVVRFPREENLTRLADLGDVLTEPNALRHVGVAFGDALVCAPFTDFDGTRDGVHRRGLLGRLDVLQSQSALLAGHP